MLVDTILRIVELTLQLSLEMVKGMTLEQRQAFWARHEERMAFWQNLIPKAKPHA